VSVYVCVCVCVCGDMCIQRHRICALFSVGSDTAQKKKVFDMCQKSKFYNMVYSTFAKFNPFVCVLYVSERGSCFSMC